MASKRRRSADDQPEAVFERIAAVVEGAPAGMHRLGSPAFVLDSAWPAPLLAAYRRFNGATLFHEAVVLWPAKEVTRREVDGVSMYQVGEWDGEELAVDAGGRVFRCEASSGEWLCEGSRFDRWLWGAIEAEMILYERDGEFADECFDEAGEARPVASERMQRCILKRDRAAVAPRWRLARALAQQGQLEAAREQLETLVATAPEFAWGWYDLGRLSERLETFECALDELIQAAEARPDYEYAGFFWAHAARVARRCERESERAKLAERALACDPGLLDAQRAGAEASLREGALDAADELAALALALAPRDLRAHDLAARIRRARDSAVGDLDD